MNLTPAEDLELRALIADAYDVRGTAAARPAYEAIAEWIRDLLFRRAQRAMWHRRARRDRLVALLRATDPACLPESSSAEKAAVHAA